MRRITHHPYHPPSLEVGVAESAFQCYADVRTRTSGDVIVTDAKGLSGMLELPVGGAYENMDMYDVDAPILQADWGAAVGMGKEGPTGIFTREFAKATIALDCNSYTSTFEPKL